MQKIRLGKTGLQVTRVGFGGIPIQRLSENEAVAVIGRCLDLGVNFIDTANAYSTSEEWIGKAIKGRREGLVLASKSMARHGETMTRHVELSLQRLGVDHIDLYQFHNISDAKSLEMLLAPGSALEALEEAKKAGKIGHIGITSHQLETAIKAVGTGRFETIMFPFNFVTDEAADKLIPLCREKQVGFIVMKALAGGMLTDARMALRYLLQFPDIVTLAGIEKEREIEEIVQILNTPGVLSPDEKTEMAAVKKKLGKKFCHRCDYCQPCPQGIFISTVMIYPALEMRLPDYQLYEGLFNDVIVRAAECTQCGDCEERCPYHLPIREMLADHVKQHEAGGSRYRK